MPQPALSFWEQNTFFRNIDVIIIGSGIVGLNAALTLAEKEPNWKIAILEKGILPAGASTRNAGFACFGSMTELLDDVAENGKEAMLKLVEKRWKGLQRLRERVGDKQLDYKAYGSYELFLPEEKQNYQRCLEQRDFLNKALQPIIGNNEVFRAKNTALDTFGFSKVKELLYNAAEGQIDTGRMMKTLLELARQKGISIYNGCNVVNVEEEGTQATVLCENGWRLFARNVLLCNNGFAKRLLPDLEVQPARNQVLITQEIPNLKFKACFHYQSGYFYFRNIGKRILLGGGRHLAKTEEATMEFDTTDKIRKALLDLLNNIILPNQEVQIEQWWSGILGVGKTKTPIVKQLSSSIYTAVRLGGMGVAIGSLTGEEGANLLLGSIKK